MTETKKCNNCGENHPEFAHDMGKLFNDYPVMGVFFASYADQIKAVSELTSEFKRQQSLIENLSKLITERS